MNYSNDYLNISLIRTLPKYWEILRSHLLRGTLISGKKIKKGKGVGKTNPKEMIERKENAVGEYQIAAV